MAKAPPPNIEGMFSLKVDNLSYSTRVDDLRPLFGKYGEIGDIYIPRNRMTNESRGFAFVRYFEKDAADAAIAGLDGFAVDGREMRVSEAKHGRPEASGRRSRYDDRDRRGPPGYDRYDRGYDRGYDRNYDRGYDRYEPRGYDRYDNYDSYNRDGYINRRDREDPYSYDRNGGGGYDRRDDRRDPGRRGGGDYYRGDMDRHEYRDYDRSRRDRDPPPRRDRPPRSPTPERRPVSPRPSGPADPVPAPRDAPAPPPGDVSPTRDADKRWDEDNRRRRDDDDASSRGE